MEKLTTDPHTVEDQSRRQLLKWSFLGLLGGSLALVKTPAFAQNTVTVDQIVASDAERLPLPTPEKAGGMSLLEALNNRRSIKQFSAKEISDQVLSNLLWATWGVNRDDGRRTIPTSMNKKSELLYVVWQQTLWLYEPMAHQLVKVASTPPTSLKIEAPVTLIYASPRDYYASGMHVGSMYQNAGLYCASVGLANVVKQTGVKELNATMKLPADYKVFIVHPIGWPA